MSVKPGQAQSDHSEGGGERRVVDPVRQRSVVPGTGVASEKCQAGVGATVSTMKRDRTPHPTRLYGRHRVDTGILGTEPLLPEGL